MANIKQQIKRNKTNEKRRQRNQAFKSSTKTAIKQVEQAIASNNKAQALEKLNLVYQKLDKGQSKGIYHKNFVARHKSILAQKVNSLA